MPAVKSGLLTALALVPGLAQAHPGDHSGFSAASAIRHGITDPLHLSLLVAATLIVLLVPVAAKALAK